MSVEKDHTQQQFWLMKSEPDVFSIRDLEARGTFRWDGVRNFEARNFLRDRMHTGDLAIFYHSSAKTIGAAGVAKIASNAYPDHTAWDPKGPYFDARSTEERPLWWMVDVAFVEAFPDILTRDAMQSEPALADMLLWKRSRLSIVPIEKCAFDRIVALGRKIKNARA
ncbi:MAG TPA: EVE domain-containing protein [Candidatus Paceibacterota bacterium]|nr:EVE domain-containing protein [Candidatus Paceibacterota bacterium]